ncbi:putative tRNA-dihydrouridine synthase [Thalassocella blandensis]|nr:putative tRNA-dihydrouridine synthase [Thalassocella blandensis]
MFNIGPYAIDSRVLLAPMAGVTDLPFRSICRKMGAGLVTSEMLSSDTRLWQSDKSRNRLAVAEDIGPISIQIAGSEPQMMADAARACAEQGAQIIDINMGCPAKKVCKKLAGSALLKDEALVKNILQAVVQSVDVPVTLKIRTGWDTQNKNAIQIAKIAENEGIQALTVHGRTRACRFNGEAEYDTIAEIVDNVNIPVVANGDIKSAEKAKEVITYTSAAAVMIGRGAWGRPWIFKQVKEYLEDDTLSTQPSIKQIKTIVLEHIEALHAFYGEFMGVRIARKHFTWYVQQLSVSNSTTKNFNQLETSTSQISAVQEFFARLNYHEEKAA